jgi:hypothetical protein
MKLTTSVFIYLFNEKLRTSSVLRQSYESGVAQYEILSLFGNEK